MRRIIPAILLAILAGCAESPTTQPSDGSVRQNKALRDPFNYGPGKDFGKTPAKDDKNGDWKSDWDRFWDP